MDNKSLYIILLIFTFAAGILLRVGLPEVQQYASGADEGYYLKYAGIFVDNGISAMKIIAKQYLSDARMQLYPSPTRIGQILISGLWMKITGGFDFRALARMSAFFSILALFAGYFFVKRLFGGKIALLSLALFAASPLNLAMARRALQDGLVYFFVLLALYAFYAAARSRKLTAHLLFMLSFFACVMVKESAVLLSASLLFFAIWDRAFYDREIRILPLIASIVAALALSLLAYAVFIGWDDFIKLAGVVFSSPATNEYAKLYQTGPFLRYAADFTLISPLTMAALAGFAVLLATRRVKMDEPILYLFVFFTVSYIIYSLFSKNLRYVIFLDLPIRVFAAIFVSKALSRFGDKAFAASFAAVAVIAAVDCVIFQNIFIGHGVYDPVTVNLLNAWRY
ncbi:MAG: glycosyltransferase family 39 protein [Candidatus Omnitrophica bacterium]|nr:glycosyltransferase family 39 protein [Candidatus Omnitrophota bacterium]